MKNTKNKILVVALVVCAVAILSLGTVAWFNATDDITNKFMIADSDNIGEPNFTVDVWENENDGDDTVDADNDGSTTTTHAGNEYDSIAPGDVLAKNPTIQNTGDYDQWIRVKVTFDEFSVIEPACQKYGIPSDLRTWIDVDSAYWTADDNATKVDGDTVTYVYYYNYKLAANQTAVLFNNVSIPEEFQQADMKYVGGNFNVNVKAEALQADNTMASAAESFAAYWNY